MAEESRQRELASCIGRLLRDSFGRGPEGVYVSLGGTFMTVYLRQFISPMEQILLQQDEEETVISTRAKLMSTLIPEIKAHVRLITGAELREVYTDWSLHNRSGMIVGVSPRPIDPEAPAVNEAYSGRDELHEEVIAISRQAERRPSETYSCELNRRTLLVIRNGILVAIEKELIRLGHEAVLKYAKSMLEKRYLHNHNHFESILNRKVIDVFVDWNFELDKSVMVFVLNDSG